MDAALRAAVRQRAADCCEYCQLRQAASPGAALQVEHVVPRKHGGGDTLDNLALACIDCNLYKGSNLTGIDPQSRQITPLFNPRQENWAAHFRWDGLRIVGRTAVGRTTVQVLRMNAALRLRFRRSARKRP